VIILQQGIITKSHTLKHCSFAAILISFENWQMAYVLPCNM